MNTGVRIVPRPKPEKKVSIAAIKEIKEIRTNSIAFSFFLSDATAAKACNPN